VVLILLSFSRPSWGSCSTCELVSRPLQSEDTQTGVVSYRYYSKANQVCFTAETYDGWQFRAVKIEVATYFLEEVNPSTFRYQSETFMATYFSRCITPRGSSVACAGSHLFLYFYAHTVHKDSSKIVPAWAFGVPFSDKGKYFDPSTSCLKFIFRIPLNFLSGYYNAYQTCCEVSCPPDMNPCTDDVCVANGVCSYPPNSAPCNDGDFCTVNDYCSEGKCQAGDAKDCSDGIFFYSPRLLSSISLPLRSLRPFRYFHSILLSRLSLSL
jgi:hypothetical protein